MLVSHTAELYGAARSLLALANGLQARGHVPLVTVPQAGPLSRALQSSGIKTVTISAPPWALPPHTSLKAKQWYLRQIVLAGRQVASLIRQLRPDLVHSNSAIFPAGALAARMADVPHVWHLREHVVEHYDQRFILGRPLSLWLMGTFSAALIAISRSVAAAYTAPATTRKLHVVYNGVDLPPYAIREGENRTPGASAVPMLALVGVLHPAKGQDEAIRALAFLHRRGFPCRLVLIGGDPLGYESTLRALVNTLGLTPYVTFTGHLPDPWVQMAQADVVLVCSRSEAFGRVTVEAMLLGKPVIGADTGGTPEIIENGRTGLLYRQGDTSGLADAIQQILLDPALAMELGQRGKESAARFSVEQYIHGVMAVYQKALEGRASPYLKSSDPC